MDIEFWEKDEVPIFENKFHEDIHIKRSKDINYLKSQNSQNQYFDWIVKNYNINGRVLDLAGGSGYLTSKLSKLNKVKEVYLLEYGENCLKYLVPKVLNHTKANKEKIKLINGSFNNIKLENFFDFVFVFGALHHSSNLRLTTDNINKCLKKGGILFGREPVSHYMTPTVLYKKDLKRRTDDNGNVRNDNFYRLGEYTTAFYQSKLEIKNIKQFGNKNFFSFNPEKCNSLYECIDTFVFVCQKDDEEIKKIDCCNWERW